MKNIKFFFSGSPHNANAVGRVRSTLSVSGVEYYLNLPPNKRPSPAISALTLTPGKVRNIDQDMENIRMSRQDNPFIQVKLCKRTKVLFILIFAAPLYFSKS